MNRDKAKKIQDNLAKHYNLGYWYGVNCNKCCDVYPKFKTTLGFDSKCYYECPVCGKRTLPADMPWIATEDWNNDKTIFSVKQVCFFE